MRDPRTLLAQIATIESFLSDGRTDEDALATCAPGWRPHDWRPDEGTQYEVDPEYRPHPPETPRYQSEIDRAVDRWPRHVVLGVPRAINAMPLLDRLIVRGVLSLGIGRTARATRLTNWVKVGEFAGCTDKTAKCHYEAALREIATLVWDEEGTPIW